jgi:uncharacterized Zn finger protein
MCKHVAAVLYGVGARLDEKPELLFTLRGADHRELVGQASVVETLTTGTGKDAAATLAAADVSDVFGIELDEGEAQPVEAIPKKAAAKAKKADSLKKAGELKKGKPGKKKVKGRSVAKKKSPTLKPKKT